MSKKRDLEIRHKADAAEWQLRANGVYHLANDEPGICFAVGEELRRRFPNSGLKIEAPLRNFGGEYTYSLLISGRKTTEGATE